MHGCSASCCLPVKCVVCRKRVAVFLSEMCQCLQAEPGEHTHCALMAVTVHLSSIILCGGEWPKVLACFTVATEVW